MSIKNGTTGGNERLKQRVKRVRDVNDPFQVEQNYNETVDHAKIMTK